MNHSRLKDEAPLPAYVVADYPQAAPLILTTPAAPVLFPLSDEDRHTLEILEKKFDGEENCSGLAAPQIGIGKQMIVFATPHDPEFKKWRPDLTQEMPKTIWINPSYKGIEEEGFREDYEACFSVNNVAAPVKRFNKIQYETRDLQGTLVQGTAEGFLARVIQHEIDHIHGILYINLVGDKDLIMPIEEYRRKRAEALEE